MSHGKLLIICDHIPKNPSTDGLQPADKIRNLLLFPFPYAGITRIRLRGYNLRRLSLCAPPPTEPFGFFYIMNAIQSAKIKTFFKVKSYIKYYEKFLPDNIRRLDYGRFWTDRDISNKNP